MEDKENENWYNNKDKIKYSAVAHTERMGTQTSMDIGIQKPEEKFLKLKTQEEILESAIKNLEEASFKFACFISEFKRYAEKLKGGK